MVTGRGVDPKVVSGWENRSEMSGSGGGEDGKGYIVVTEVES